jgi:hypothetical protein
MPPFFSTDKLEPHGYFQTYAQLAGELGPAASVCELGVADGESLRMWQSFFPLGEVTGVDMDPQATWPEGTKRVVCQQDSPDLLKHLRGKFDLIVDDCSHNGILTRKSFGLLWNLVNPGGYYVIEDWMVALRDGTEPGETWGPQANWGDSMLRTAEGFLPMLSHRDGQCDFILYRYGMIIIHRSANA